MKLYKEHYRSLLQIGIPIMIGQLGMIVLGFADTMMVGHHSTTELGAASFVNNIITLVIIAGTGFSYGLTPVVGGFFGRNELPEAGQALRCSLLANTLVAFIMMALLTVFYFNLGNIGQPDELLPYMRPYFLVLLASLPFVMLFNAFKQFTDGITETRTSMWILLSGNALNIVGNYLLIYGKLGLPELGVVGAGLSTLLSRVMMVVIFLAVFLGKRSFRRYRVGFFGKGWSRRLVLRLNQLGWPIALEMGMETASFSLSIIMVGWLGTIALASHQVMTTISQFTFMVYYGLGAAVAVRTSYFHGQRDMTNTRHTVVAGLHVMVALEVLLAGIILIHSMPGILLAGVVLFALTTLFSFITLPVEIDASRRATAWLLRAGITSASEQPMAVSALKSAAYTYVVAALSSLATLAYYVMILVGGRSRD